MEADEPPLRLALGPDGYAIAAEVSHERLAEADRWRALSESTSFT